MIRAFVSSTYRDLKDHRAHVIRRLRKSGVFVDPMEDWTAATDEPKDLSQDRVKGCDVCILLVGFRRGHVPGGQGPSITQMEFQEALKQRIEVLAFMADEEADWPAGAFSELDDEMKRWRSDLREHHDVERFTPAPESIDVQSALFRWWDKAKDAGERTALDLPADGGAFPLEIRACSNSEGVLIAWRTLEPIAGCQGFALHRRTLGEAAVTEDIVATGLGFSPAGVGRHAPSTVWPIQNFRWTDYPSGQTAPDRAAAPEVRYRVSAMLGETGNLRESETISSGWTRWVSRRTGQTPGLRAYFNPGTGWSAGLARAHAKKEPGDLSLLGGELRRRLLDLLGTARRLEQRVYVAVSALDDGEVIAALKALGPRLYILLGPVGAAVCDELLAGSVNLYHRVLKPPRRASNNFAVFCDRWGAPVQVWTGSGAWTSRALCLRSNHAILADSAELALAYRDRWDVLRDAGGACTRRLLQASSRPAQVTLGGASITLWNTPVHGAPDLRDATRLVRSAREGVLFLMRPCALQNEILSLAGEDLFIQGISSSPSAGARSTLLQQRAGLVSGLPVDSTLVLVDPFGPHPVVIAGSHDLTPAASARCDNNLLIVENAPGLAAELTVHIIRLYDRFRFRAVLAAMPDRPGPLSLDSSGAWQRRYFDDAKRSEFNFLFGELWPGL